MQQRMKDFIMTDEAIHALLERAPVGRISTLGEDGWPYTVAVHFVWVDGQVYFHGLPRGEKLANIARDSRVCFECDELTGILYEGVTDPCKADAAYESVVIRGRAGLLTDPEEKLPILRAIIGKYVPSMAEAPIAPAMLAGTAVVKVTPERITGKYHE